MVQGLRTSIDGETRKDHLCRRVYRIAPWMDYCCCKVRNKSCYRSLCFGFEWLNLILGDVYCHFYSFKTQCAKRYKAETLS